MNWNDFFQFISSLFSKPSVDNSTQNQTKIIVTRIISNTNGQFDTIQVSTNNVVTWSGVVGENNILPNCPIQTGQYHIQWYNSPTEGYQDIILVNVPNHDFIEGHEGNYPNSNPKHPSYGDSKGCLLIGESLDDQVNPTMVCNSDAAFAEFKSKLPQDLSNVILEIV
jgi:hypothetical protein